jgi:integrase
MARKALNSKVVESIKAGKDGEIFWDEGFKHGSFGLRVFNSGKKKYIFNYRNSRNQQKRMTIGDAALMSLSDARNKATEFAVAVNKGIDPVDDKKRLRESETFEEVAKRFLESKKNKRGKTLKEYRRIIEKELLPTLGKLKIKEIKKKDIAIILDNIGTTRNKGPLAEHVKTLIQGIFKYAAQRDIIHQSVAENLPEYHSYEPRDRTLSDEELKNVLVVLAKHKSEPTFAALKMILFTGQRPGVTMSMCYDEIDGRNWVIPAGKMKKNVLQWTWLSDTSLAIISEMKQRAEIMAQVSKKDYAGSYETYVFASRYSGPTTTLNHACDKLVELSGAEHFTPHDLRRTSVTIMRELGADIATITKILAHNNDRKNATAIYDRSTLLPLIEKALKELSDYLINLENDLPNEKKIIRFPSIKKKSEKNLQNLSEAA